MKEWLYFSSCKSKHQPGVVAGACILPTRSLRHGGYLSLGTQGDLDNIGTSVSRIKNRSMGLER